MVTGDQMPEGYETDLVEDLLFTEAELDMIYFSCLHDIGHPEAHDFALSDNGFDTLLAALKKIQDWSDNRAEPDVMRAM